MCFSAQASFAAASVIAILGSLSLSQARSKNIIPFAMIPLLFAVQQAFEGIVWLTFDPAYTHIHHISTLGFLFFAYIVWPLWIPGALYILEKENVRKKWLAITFGFGIVSVINLIIFLYGWGSLGITAQIMNHHITYNVISPPEIPLSINLLLYLIYTIATIAPCFISSVACMWIFGLIVAAGFIVAQIFYCCAFASVWCFFAAVASGMSIYIIKKRD